ncbi:unnamed protein product [Acanthoscelides obtectus]|uniref:Uncharacterized protein n=1 Tax=Acanthoscelides obtectus TaxID=200917 RepID=A0A9P0K1I7_ACAOB|nr:unnamed protein product [Acanthoscelides obtectus]CAK1639510.1 hypothetical protein AOBTE_LOCUS11220 [Acanthoscelides obtectus]
MAEKPEAAPPSASEALPPPHHALQNHLVAVYVANEPTEYGYAAHRPPYANSGEECLVTYHPSAGVVGEPPAPSPSSCSSLSSSTDEGGGAIVSSAHQEVVLYEGTPSVVGRNTSGGVVLAVRQPQQQQGSGQVVVQHHPQPVQQQQQFVSVPYGWKRILNNGSVVYIRNSPSDSCLRSSLLTMDFPDNTHLTLTICSDKIILVMIM